MDNTNAGPLVTTFSIVGYDPDVPAWGVAIASRFLAVGAQTCWTSPDAGVVVVQAHLNADNGTEGLRLLREGSSAPTTIERLMDADPHQDLRQIALIDRSGTPATFTGNACTEWAGGALGKHCAAQGNMLFSGDGCAAMVDNFEKSTGNLTRRLVNALTIGDSVSGDARGRQSAALKVVRPPWDSPFDVFTEPTIDLRVDDHREPFQELARLLDLHELLYHPTTPNEHLEQTTTSISKVQDALASLGIYNESVTGILDDATVAALNQLKATHNLRNRMTPDSWIDQRVLTYLEDLAATSD
jgi:uncharacterized Ntn-hydrolase superfamily protein